GYFPFMNRSSSEHDRAEESQPIWLPLKGVEEVSFLDKSWSVVKLWEIKICTGADALTRLRFCAPREMSQWRPPGYSGWLWPQGDVSLFILLCIWLNPPLETNFSSRILRRHHKA